MYLHLLGGVFLGWSLGANDAANIFGTAVSSRMVRFGSAVTLCSIFAVIGAALEGHAGIETIGRLASQSLDSATLTAVAAALSMTMMTALRIPASSSQAVVGAIIGIGIFGAELRLGALQKVVVCWVGTPIGGLVIAVILYRLLGNWLNRMQLSLYSQDVLLRGALVLAGCYGSYALGANNVANVTAVYYGAGLISMEAATLIGGASIAFGVITFSKRVMQTVGTSIVRLDAFAAFIVVLAQAITVHIYAWIGVPVSTSQAVVGAVIGVGLVKQASAVRLAVVGRIILGWLATPLIAGAVAVLLHFVTHLRYVP